MRGFRISRIARSNVFAHESAKHLGGRGILLTTNLQKALPEVALDTNA
jgi:hypothetical protein